MGAAIGSAILSVLADLQKLYEGRASERDVLDIIESSIGKREAMTKRLCEAFDSYLREEVIGKAVTEHKKTLRLMTLSASSTIRESILHFLRMGGCNSDISLESLDVRVLESRPLYEGVSLASAIVSSFQSVREGPTRLNVSLYTDSSAALAARDIDVLLIGADRIAGYDGAVSNKIGSLAAVLAAKYVSPQARILVISELDKVAQAESIESHPEEDNDAEEVLRAWRLARVKGADIIDNQLGSGLAVKNIYFEWVPSGLINSYITDGGVMDVAGIRERSAWVSRQVHRFFDDLWL